MTVNEQGKVVEHVGPESCGYEVRIRFGGAMAIQH